MADAQTEPKSNTTNWRIQGSSRSITEMYESLPGSARRGVELEWRGEGSVLRLDSSVSPAALQARFVSACLACGRVSCQWIDNKGDRNYCLIHKSQSATY